MGSRPNWEQSMLCSKSYQILHRNRISMLTGLKVSSLACKCVFYRLKHRDPMKLNFEGLEMQKWNIPTDRTQGVDEKNRIICLVNHVYYQSYGQ